MTLASFAFLFTGVLLNAGAQLLLKAGTNAVPLGLRLAIETVSAVARFVVPLGGAAWTALLPLVIFGAAAIVIAFDRRRTQHA